MSFDHDSLELLAEALRTLERGFDGLPPAPPRLDREAARAALLAAAKRMTDNYPYHHPLYVGQMLKPPHPVARLAYALSLWINPNNHALDGGRASSAMEKEAVAAIARMFGWETHLGHLCGGGTMANFEALWVARELRPGAAVAASAQAHYTHARLSAVLGVPFRTIAVDGHGRMDAAALEQELAAGGIGTVVATLGTTAAGAVDPLPEILDLRRRHDFRLHVDAAYGGYFILAGNLDAPARRAYDRIGAADSIVLDPHKHGLQPYGCGCVLFADPAVGRFYRHDSPYTYFSSPDLHLGEISLECSRPGAAAVALWTTLRLLPLQRGGTFARGLEAGRSAALALHQALEQDRRFAPLLVPELDIVVWAVRAASARAASARARQVFDAAAQRDLHLALSAFPRAMLEAAAPVRDWDAGEITCLRACVMKPEQREWLPEILRRLDAASGPPA
ncbi:MAG: aminotransferase class V-fold PLP-dependent enzyme [Planctomycetota bacterium]|nr:MAG: aminotransferase class V-fold PLP-dependent enzyme [Planctomycetota bacterium]